MAYIYVPDGQTIKKDDGLFVLLGIGVGAALIWYFYFREGSGGGKLDSERGNETPAVFNKNPLNIKVNKYKYFGEITPKGNKYKQFNSWENGVLAGIYHLNRYFSGEITGSKLNTIRKIIYTWAPPSDGNDTEGYISYVSKQMQTGQNTILTFEKNTIGKLVKAMANREDGKATQEVTKVRFEKAWEKFENKK
jgi:hypothetical protein